MSIEPKSQHELRNGVREWISKRIQELDSTDIDELRKFILQVDSNFDETDVNIFIVEYVKWLAIFHVGHLKKFLVHAPPTIDKLWVKHIFDTVSYERISIKFFNKIIFRETHPTPDYDGVVETGVFNGIRIYNTCFGTPKWHWTRKNKLATKIIDQKSQIFVRVPGRQLMVMIVDLDVSTLSDFCDIFSIKKGFEIHSYRFLFAGKQLEKNKLLSYYNILKESTLDAMTHIQDC